MHTEKQEEEIVRLLLHYSNELIELEDAHAETAVEEKKISVAEFLVHEILQDEIVFENTTYASIFKIFSESVQS